MSGERKVQWRGGFSDRTGVSKISTAMQIERFDDRTKVAISNLLFKIYDNEITGVEFSCEIKDEFLTKLIADVYGESIVNFSYNTTYSNAYYQIYIEKVINESSYADILTIIEFFIAFVGSLDPEEFYREERNFMYGGMPSEIVARLINGLFEQEFVGYRIIDKKAVPIYDKIEQKEIEKTLSVQFAGCKSHIKKALGFLSDRENPDYKNSIKESISSVESICQIITGDNSATLGQALKVLEDKGLVLHPALKKGFSSLYGYTSDEGGIRHAEGMFESDVTFEQSKYMLVSCCSFVNFLIAEYGRIKN